MRSILSGGRAVLFLLAITCLACGGGGGGGPSTLGNFTAEIDIPNPGETAIVILQVLSDGTVNWNAAVPPDVVPVVTGLTINLASDASVFADLLGATTFDPATGTASGSVTLTPANAALLAADPADYVVTLLTSTKPPASGGLIVFTAAEWHAVLLGSNESPVADADARGAATLRITSPTSMTYVIAMVDPVQADVTMAHIHIGAAGVNGLIVISFEPATTGTRDAAAGTITGTVTVDAAQVARVAADLENFYFNVHTAAAPNGVVRGQLREGTFEMTAALAGSAEVPTVVDANARGGATFEFESLTQGRVLLALDSATEDIDDIIMMHIHTGAAGAPGPIFINLMGADYATDPSSYSAESTFTYTQKDITRVLANPAGFYANFHTTAAQAGLVRGQLSTDPRTLNAILAGAEETPPVTGSGTMRVVFTGVHSCAYTINMTTPAASSITGAHIHDGPAGTDGLPLVDLFLSGDAVVNGNVISGTAAVPGRTQARMLAGTPGGTGLAGGALPSLWYGDVHTLANPNGNGRGQFTQSSIADPPAGLAYTTPVTYLTASPISANSPTSTGGAITLYTISPALSAGLGISATTGVISGTPTATKVATDYTVTASNASGSTTAVVNITVNVGPPTLLLYTTPVTYVAGQAITPNNPTSAGGAISSYTVLPALPANLVLNPTTGVISGTPTAGVAVAQAGYVVTGSNAAGSVNRTVQITITLSLQAPSNLSYSSGANPSYPTGYAITDNVPTISGGTVATWSVNPALPNGLTLGTDGKITGTPTTVTSQAAYVVTATNASGSTTATLNITITLGLPGPFTYSNDNQLLYNNSAMNTMSPTHTGGGPVTSYALTGTLPNGLNAFNTTNGNVSGTPSGATATNGYVTYTVTATNATGSTTGTFSIWVY